jgi:hypothetical protein
LNNDDKLCRAAPFVFTFLGLCYQRVIRTALVKPDKEPRKAWMPAFTFLFLKAEKRKKEGMAWANTNFNFMMNFFFSYLILDF